MEQAEALLKAGDLDGCLKEVTARIRADSAAIAPRVFLFQLFCVLGEWERARRQLYVLKDMDAGTIPMFEVYDSVIQCEHMRSAVFAGKRSPLMFGKPSQWLADLAAALAALAEGRKDEAERLRDAAFDAAPGVAGQINGDAFEWLADADGRLGPVLEVFLNGHYYWVPINAVASITIEPPADLRDLVWTPAEFRWANGGEAVGFIPTRYPGTETCDDNRLKLSRLTEWTEAGNELVVGHGQRILVTDQNDYPLLGVEKISLEVTATGSDEGLDG
ncbi:MAG: virulence protein SciE type [Wenzhouxiangella sp.]|nr:MAG: virulence protein SciE type [Wenzhouxiangella sp.]